MIFIIFFIGFLLITNMSQRSNRSRRHFFHNDFPPPPYGFNGGYSYPYFHREMPFNGQNTEGGYQQFQREQRQQSMYYTLLFLMGLIALLFYLHG
jgi:hypothetical protein